jgi:hypothetical protein
VPRPNQEDDGLRRARTIFNAWMGRRIVSDSDVRAAFSDFVQHVVNGQTIYPNSQLRIARTERGEHFLDQGVDVALTDRQLHMTLLKPL